MPAVYCSSLCAVGEAALALALREILSVHLSVGLHAPREPNQVVQMLLCCGRLGTRETRNRPPYARDLPLHLRCTARKRAGAQEMCFPGT